MYLAARRGIRLRDGETFDELARIRNGRRHRHRGPRRFRARLTASEGRLTTPASQVFDAWPVVRSNGQTVDVYILAYGDGDGQLMDAPYGTPTAELIHRRAGRTYRAGCTGTCRTCTSSPRRSSPPTTSRTSCCDCRCRTRSQRRRFEKRLPKTCATGRGRSPNSRSTRACGSKRIEQTILNLVPAAYEIASATLPVNMPAVENTAYLCDTISVASASIRVTETRQETSQWQTTCQMPR